MFMGITDNLSGFCERMLVDGIEKEEQATLARLHRSLLLGSPAAAIEEISASKPTGDWMSNNELHTRLIETYH
jgi:hypothetical protein